MQSILAKLQAKEGSEDALEKILRTLAAATSAEPGAVVYEILRDSAHRQTFVVYERYADTQAKESHLASAHLAAALGAAKPLLAAPPEIKSLDFAFGARSSHERIDGRIFEIRVLPLGPASLVYARGEKGLLACGAIDPQALERLGIPAARVKPPEGKSSIACLDDLLAGVVRDANPLALALGIEAGMPGRQALGRL